MKKYLFRSILCIVLSAAMILPEVNTIIAANNGLQDYIDTSYEEIEEMESLEKDLLEQEETKTEEVLSESTEETEEADAMELAEDAETTDAVEVTEETEAIESEETTEETEAIESEEITEETEAIAQTGESENENIISNAVAIQLDRQYTGSLTPSMPLCVYKVTLSQSGTFNINARSSNIERLVYVLYDVNGESIVSTNTKLNSTTGLNSGNINWIITSGTYYLSIGTYNASGSFNFTLSMNGSGESFREANGGSNNSIATANSISLGKTYTAQIAENDDSDYFKFTLSSPSELTISMLSATETVSYNLYGYDGNILTDRYTYTISQGDKKIYHLTKGTFYISFSEYHYGMFGSYTASIYKFNLTANAVSETFQENNGGSNNTLMTANGISLGKTYYGQIAENDSVDFFKFAIGATQKMSLLVSAEEVFQYKIYDYNGNEIWDDTDDSNTFTIELQAGTYYLGVHRYVGWYSSGNTGTYSFRLSAYQPDSSQITQLENTKKGIKLTWSSSSSATGYKIYRKKGNGSYKLIKTIGNGKTTSYTDKKVSNKKTYTYKMITMEKSYSSVYSSSKTIYCIKKTSAVKKLKKTSSGFSVKIKKVSKAKGYEVQYSRNKSFSGAYSKKTKKRTCKISVYKSSYYKYIYYVRVRYYKKVGKKTYYSPWSKNKKIKI